MISTITQVGKYIMKARIVSDANGKLSAIITPENNCEETLAKLFKLQVGVSYSRPTEGVDLEIVRGGCIVEPWYAGFCIKS